MPAALSGIGLDGLRARILREFGKRARVAGLRSVVMAELARDLGISSKTLYRCFPTKDEMVRGLIDRWVERLFVGDGNRYQPTHGDARTALREWGEAWVTGIQRFSPAFWTELERDYPDAYAAYSEAARELRARARESFASRIRPELPADFAQALFLSMVRTAADPVFCERLAMTRRDAVVAAIDVWSRGALDERQAAEPVKQKGNRR